MKVQKGLLSSTNKSIWLVFDDDYNVVKPIQKYISYLLSVNKSPGTIRKYAYNLKLYWEYLHKYGIEWRSINLEDLADFLRWLRCRDYDPKVISIEEKTARRAESTIQNILSTIYQFIEFHQRLGIISGELNTIVERKLSTRKFKSF